MRLLQETVPVCKLKGKTLWRRTRLPVQRQSVAGLQRTLQAHVLPAGCPGGSEEQAWLWLPSSLSLASAMLTPPDVMAFVLYVPPLFYILNHG